MATLAVPNEHPANTSPTFRIAVVGEAPGLEECSACKPFVGTSGKFLMALMKQAGLERSQYFLGNVCQVYPPDGKIFKLPPDSPELRAGVIALKADLQRYNPNLVLLLGDFAFKHCSLPERSLANWRGSLFRGVGPAEGFKCMASYHPARALRNYEWAPILQMDIRRAVRHSRAPDLVSPERDLGVGLSHHDIVSRLYDLLHRKPTVAFDIEGYAQGAGVTCISFAESASRCFVVPFKGAGWSIAEEAELWQLIAQVLEDPELPKVAQNALYDCFVLPFMHGIRVRGLVGDTMLGHWELNCELEKSLEFQASIYTDEPYWKSGKKATDYLTHLKYNATDSAVTYEIWTRQQAHLSGGSRNHYDFNMSMLDPLLYMSLRGMRYDKELAANMREANDAEWNNEVAQFRDMVKKPVNTKSWQQVQEVLFKDLGLPKKWKRDKHGNDKLTSDYNALLELALETEHPAVLKLISVKYLQKKGQYLAIKTDADGRIRCSYNLVGTETGRLSCSKSPTGSGTNLQTIPSDLRRLFKADEGSWFFQCDLAGADGWTVAAHCAALGDPTMLEDYRFGLKPAKILTLAHRRGPEIFGLDRAALKELSKEVGGNEEWDYFTSKKIQHGTNYGMQPLMLRKQVFVESEGKVNITTKQARTFQDLYRQRYRGLERWHAHTSSAIRSTGCIICPNGHVRHFLGRTGDAGTLREALSHEPQMNTTWATNLALKWMWNDWSRGSVCEPLHSVHDALCGQFHKDRLAEARASLSTYFANPINIAGIEIQIPYEAHYGPSWGEKVGEL